MRIPCTLPAVPMYSYNGRKFIISKVGHMVWTVLASQAIQPPRAVLFFLLISLLDGCSFANVIKGIVAFKHLIKTVTLTSITDL